MTHRFTAILLAAVIGVGTVTALAFVLTDEGDADTISLQGVPDEDVEGWANLLDPSGAEEPAVTAKNAVDSASGTKPDSEVLEVVLVRAVQGENPTFDHLAWAVNFDPSTVLAAPLSGPIGFERPRLCNAHPQYDVVFIDANSGEFIFEMQKANIADFYADGECPPGPSFPPPTQVPGQ